MPEVGDQHQIILLPEENYWDWVGVVRDYAVRYRASVTPTPEKAVRFHRPNQVITLVDAPGAFADYAPIVDWLRQAAPEVALDVIRAGTPEELKSVLDERIRQGQRFGAQTVDGHRADALPLRLRWPTDHPVITQAFGATPEVYRRWGLPGHDGLDFRAPMNSRVYACADGEVYMVHDGTGGHPYGSCGCAMRRLRRYAHQPRDRTRVLPRDETGWRVAQLGAQPPAPRARRTA